MFSEFTAWERTWQISSHLSFMLELLRRDDCSWSGETNQIEVIHRFHVPTERESKTKVLYSVLKNFFTGKVFRTKESEENFYLARKINFPKSLPERWILCWWTWARITINVSRFHLPNFFCLPIPWPNRIFPFFSRCQIRRSSLLRRLKGIALIACISACSKFLDKMPTSQSCKEELIKWVIGVTSSSYPSLTCGLLRKRRGTHASSLQKMVSPLPTCHPVPCLRISLPQKMLCHPITLSFLELLVGKRNVDSICLLKHRLAGSPDWRDWRESSNLVLPLELSWSTPYLWTRK